MPNQMMIDIFSARARGLVAEGLALGTLAHSGVMGTAREVLVRQILEPLLPPTIKALTGTIVTCEGQARSQRNQDDIVLFNVDRAPLYWSAPGCAIMPIEGVVAHIEVKSTLNATHVREAVKAAGELVFLPQHVPTPPGPSAPVGMIFAFASDLSGQGKTEFDRLQEAVASKWQQTPGRTRSPIQTLCVVGGGCWMLYPFTGRSGRVGELTAKRRDG